MTKPPQFPLLNLLETAGEAIRLLPVVEVARPVMKLPSQTDLPQDPVADRSLILGLMAKYWTAGQVKTRLGASIGMNAAAAIHRLFTCYLCQNLCQSAARADLCVTPQERVPDFRQSLDNQKLLDSWQIVNQGAGDLGQRMSHWFAQNLSTDDCRAVLIGADCPTLGPDDLFHADQLLRRHDVVIGPAVDGGYYLIGLHGQWNQRFAALFLDVPWSGPDVLRITCEEIARQQLSLAKLPVREDVDTLVELNRLRRRLAELEASEPHAVLGDQIEKILKRSASDDIGLGS